MREVRFVLDGRPEIGFTDLVEDKPPAVWDADGLRIAFFLSAAGDRETAFDYATISALTLELREDEAETDLLIAAVSPEAALSACTYADFVAGTDKHGSFLLTGAQLNFTNTAKRFWASIRATISGGQPVTFGAGYFTVRHTLHGASGDPPSGPLAPYYTAAEVDALLAGILNAAAIRTTGNNAFGTGGTDFSILEWGTGQLSGGQASIGITNLGAGNACCLVVPRTPGIGALSANQDFSGGQLDVTSYDPATGLTVMGDTRVFSWFLIDIAT